MLENMLYIKQDFDVLKTQGEQVFGVKNITENTTTLNILHFV